MALAYQDQTTINFKSAGFFLQKNLKASPKLNKKCFTELGAKALFQLVATDSLDNEP